MAVIIIYYLLCTYCMYNTSVYVCIIIILVSWYIDVCMEVVMQVSSQYHYKTEWRCSSKCMSNNNKHA